MISRTAQSIFPLAEWARDHVILFPLVFFTGRIDMLICSDKAVPYDKGWSDVAGMKNRRYIPRSLAHRK